MSVWLGIEVQAVPRPTDMKHPCVAEGCYLLAHSAGYGAALRLEPVQVCVQDVEGLFWLGLIEECR